MPLWILLIWLVYMRHVYRGGHVSGRGICNPWNCIFWRKVYMVARYSAFCPTILPNGCGYIAHLSYNTGSKSTSPHCMASITKGLVSSIITISCFFVRPFWNHHIPFLLILFQVSSFCEKIIGFQSRDLFVVKSGVSNRRHQFFWPHQHHFSLPLAYDTYTLGQTH